MHRRKSIVRQRCVEERAAESLSERLRLIVDLKGNPDLHPWIEEEIDVGRWFVTVLIEPNLHVGQPLGQIIFVGEGDFRRSHSFA